ncbi:hypothetical protein B0H34DRAFT_715868 [Crassisporium funariophilum]|nr:hypothetical protein B0H34DRAFT_715868 [Crassisporium funariophilum]
MSAPINIATPRSSSASTSSSPASGSGSSPSSARLYVPVHKRNGSNASSSSRTPSPSRMSVPSVAAPASGEIPTHPYIYTPAMLLSLRPYAEEKGLKDKLRVACPEVVMNRRMKKNLEFTRPQRVEVEKKDQQSAPRTLSVNGNGSTTPRVTPRRNRPAGRAPERRRNALQSSFGRHATLDSWRTAVVLPPALLV